ncbi:hypothetical protein ACQ4PT_069835 [Festuca glaucescens]
MSAPATTTATAYGCAACGADLNLSAAHLYPAGCYFEAGNKGTLSFSWVDESRLRFAAEDRIRPFFETLDYWGIQRKRTRISCDALRLPPRLRLRRRAPDHGGDRAVRMGPSQVIPRRPGTGSRSRPSPRPPETAAPPVLPSAAAAR